jgi:hypothetical protein
LHISSQTTSHLKGHTLPTTTDVVWHKIICKRSSWRKGECFNWHLLKLLRIDSQTWWGSISTLLSQHPNHWITVTTVEILENSIWSLLLTLFLKNK